jgi:hypothetical protein
VFAGANQEGNGYRSQQLDKAIELFEWIKGEELEHATAQRLVFYCFDNAVETELLKLKPGG